MADSRRNTIDLSFWLPINELSGPGVMLVPPGLLDYAAAQYSSLEHLFRIDMTGILMAINVSTREITNISEQYRIHAHSIDLTTESDTQSNSATISNSSSTAATSTSQSLTSTTASSTASSTTAAANASSANDQSTTTGIQAINVSQSTDQSVNVSSQQSAQLQSQSQSNVLVRRHSGSSVDSDSSADASYVACYGTPGCPSTKVAMSSRCADDYIDSTGMQHKCGRRIHMKCGKKNSSAANPNSLRCYRHRHPTSISQQMLDAAADPFENYVVTQANTQSSQTTNIGGATSNALVDGGTQQSSAAQQLGSGGAKVLVAEHVHASRALTFTTDAGDVHNLAEIAEYKRVTSTNGNNVSVQSQTNIHQVEQVHRTTHPEQKQASLEPTIETIDMTDRHDHELWDSQSRGAPKEPERTYQFDEHRRQLQQLLLPTYDEQIKSSQSESTKSNASSPDKSATKSTSSTPNKNLASDLSSSIAGVENIGVGVDGEIAVRPMLASVVSVLSKKLDLTSTDCTLTGLVGSDTILFERAGVGSLLFSYTRWPFVNAATGEIEYTNDHHSTAFMVVPTFAGGNCVCDALVIAHDPNVWFASSPHSKATLSSEYPQEVHSITGEIRKKWTEWASAYRQQMMHLLGDSERDYDTFVENIAENRFHMTTNNLCQLFSEIYNVVVYCFRSNYLNDEHPGPAAQKPKKPFSSFRHQSNHIKPYHIFFPKLKLYDSKLYHTQRVVGLFQKQENDDPSTFHCYSLVYIPSISHDVASLLVNYSNCSPLYPVEVIGVYDDVDDDQKLTGTQLTIYNPHVSDSVPFGTGIRLSLQPTGNTDVASYDGYGVAMGTILKLIWHSNFEGEHIRYARCYLLYWNVSRSTAGEVGPKIDTIELHKNDAEFDAEFVALHVKSDQINYQLFRRTAGTIFRESVMNGFEGENRKSKINEYLLKLTYHQHNHFIYQTAQLQQQLDTAKIPLPAHLSRNITAFASPEEVEAKDAENEHYNPVNSPMREFDERMHQQRERERQMDEIQNADENLIDEKQLDETAELSSTADEFEDEYIPVDKTKKPNMKLIMKNIQDKMKSKIGPPKKLPISDQDSKSKSKQQRTKKKPAPINTDTVTPVAGRRRSTRFSGGGISAPGSTIKRPGSSASSASSGGHASAYNAFKKIHKADVITRMKQSKYESLHDPPNDIDVRSFIGAYKIWTEILPPEIKSLYESLDEDVINSYIGQKNKTKRDKHFQFFRYVPIFEPPKSTVAQPSPRRFSSLLDAVEDDALDLEGYNSQDDSTYIPPSDSQDTEMDFNSYEGASVSIPPKSTSRKTSSSGSRSRRSSLLSDAASSTSSHKRSNVIAPTSQKKARTMQSSVEMEQMRQFLNEAHSITNEMADGYASEDLFNDEVMEERRAQKEMALVKKTLKGKNEYDKDMKDLYLAKKLQIVKSRHQPTSQQPFAQTPIRLPASATRSIRSTPSVHGPIGPPTYVPPPPQQQQQVVADVLPQPQQNAFQSSYYQPTGQPGVPPTIPPLPPLPNGPFNYLPPTIPPGGPSIQQQQPYQQPYQHPTPQIQSRRESIAPTETYPIDTSRDRSLYQQHYQSAGQIFSTLLIESNLRTKYQERVRSKEEIEEWRHNEQLAKSVRKYFDGR